ncbi:hypothetical protein BDV96DRAFT_552992 [Lophiotrema nucula]|uniref:Rad4 transglutaminase-like domain-containing protein n=1 Tax=Lophiotrema nucula TaxID=690887 RepID=A0A6A5YVV2_9PLEO|nr:hypothetical protein BDV96DRAFT_552992 [Lophiotrema nucula]
MAGPRGRARKATTRAAPVRSSRRGKASQHDAEVPDVFHDMLSEAQASKAAGVEEDSKPLKKRKAVRATRQESSSPAPEPIQDSASRVASIPARRVASSRAPVPKPAAPESDDEEPQTRILQTITDSEESDESDMEWEDALAEEEADDDDAEPEVGDVSITIGGSADEEKKAKRRVQRRGITSVDRKRRLDVHKMHILCLLYHVHLRNVWCNDQRVQAALRKLPSPKTLSNLVPNPDFTQYQSSKRFTDGMGELKHMWSNRFNVTALGMHKPRWNDADAEAQAFSDFDELDHPMDKQDFKKAASVLNGSQDVGAQLFCALLRTVGVEARLVCSLQVLPFASATQASTPQKPSPNKRTIVLDPYNIKASPSKPRTGAPPRPKKLSRMERILGERSAVLSSGVAPKRQKKYHTPYPVYWVEAFNPAVQKWVPIDPMSTSTVDKADKLEPPLNFSQNSLVYAVAFEDDSTAKDVTRRYAKAYNAKTRKFRVESTDGGARWWKQTLKVFRRHAPLDRDQVEDAALARKEAAEGMPKNVQDYKNHPVYALERHLRHNEVLHPMHQVGKVNVGSSMNPKMEPIYRRKDVHIVRSADKWYRMGRDVKDGEQPLKHAKPKKGRRSVTPAMDVDQLQEEIGTALYAAFQTELYIPPPVIRGKVPRNAYGNLDVYVPSMVPKGGTHIRHKLAAKAARIVSVDFAEAITGFSFKGRHGTAIVQGVIVASEFAESVEAAIAAMEYQQVQTEHSQRTAEALRLWRRFYLGLRIAQRVNAIEIDGETGPVVDVQGEIEREDREMKGREMAGGFFIDEAQREMEYPAPVRRQRHVVEDDEDMEDVYVPEVDKSGGGFLSDKEDDSGGFIPPRLDHTTSFGSALLESQELRPRRSDDFGGDFLSDEDDDDAGGFMREPSPIPQHLAHDNTGIDLSMSGGAGGFLQTDGAADADADAEDFEGGGFIPEESGEMEELEVPWSSSPSDAGSLPLEDPDEEDADPDWLVDVT